tara:strand:- start:197 stop:556 length:360 start_codon:yes stop_codon:yes gene_type:complete
MLFASVNLIDMEDVVIDWVVDNEMAGNSESWEDNEWGFYEELSFKVVDESIFDDVDETGVQTNISKGNEHFDKFLTYSLDKSDAFFDENGTEIEKQEYEVQVKGSESCVISISECHPEM